MPKSLAVRISTGVAAGLAITIAMFALLFHLVDVQVADGDILKPVRIEFTRTIVDTNVQVKRRMVKVERQAVPETPQIPNGEEPDPRVTKTIVQIDPELFPRPGIDGIDGGPGVGIELEHGTDQDVQPVFRLLPEYPMWELTRGVEGWVRVQFNVTPSGSVADAVVVASEPRGSFDEAALTAVSGWRYSPRIVDGEAVERVGLQTTIEFQLTE